MSSNIPQERNLDACIHIRDLDPMVTESLLWELMIQAAPVVKVFMPKDKLTQQHSGRAYIEFQSEADADYVMRIMNYVRLFGRPLRLKKGNKDKIDVGANLFIGGLDNEVDEKLLNDTFVQFGMIIQPPKVMRDPTSGQSKGFGFVSFDNFNSSDAAIETMNGQFLCNKPITVTYARKKDSTERHGSQAERMIAAGKQRGIPVFGGGPYPPSGGMPMPPMPPMPPGGGGGYQHHPLPPHHPGMMQPPPPPGMMQPPPPPPPLNGQQY
ncbi:hypothetical protein SAMD00019534_088190, partial [Acytostelium subglobosum LB1]|uniref:hypothetical protein n=1 Tax=Acytostelium subglobosum LB1 TaxID=1410327 RepID=UPI000644C653